MGFAGPSPRGDSRNEASPHVPDRTCGLAVLWIEFRAFSRGCLFREKPLRIIEQKSRLFQSPGNYKPKIRLLVDLFGFDLKLLCESALFRSEIPDGKRSRCFSLVRLWFVGFTPSILSRLLRASSSPLGKSVSGLLCAKTSLKFSPNAKKPNRRSFFPATLRAGTRRLRIALILRVRSHPLA